MFCACIDALLSDPTRRSIPKTAGMRPNSDMGKEARLDADYQLQNPMLPAAEAERPKGILTYQPTNVMKNSVSKEDL